MKLTVHTFLTLDGVMQGPGGPDEDVTGGFTRGGWVVPLFDEGMGEIVGDWFGKADAFLIGRTTYDLFYPYWSQITDPNDVVATKLNALPKYVASTTLRDPEWQNTTVLSDDVLGQIKDLKSQPGGELQIHGSCGLLHTLHNSGLIDEYRLLVFPVTVGKGKRLFTDDTQASGFSLVSSRTTKTGAVYSELRPKQFDVGRFGIEDGGVAPID